MLKATKKIALDSFSDIKKSAYLSKGGYCFYTRDEEGQAIEFIIDNIVPKGKKTIWLFDNRDKNEFYIVFSWSLQNSIILKKEKKVTIDKLISILRFYMAKERVNKVCMVEGGTIQEAIKEKVPIEFIPDQVFAKFKKNTPILEAKKRSSSKLIVLVLGVVISIFVTNTIFKYQNDSLTDEFTISDANITSAKLNYKKEVQKTKNRIKELKDKQKNIASSINDVLKKGY